jgi:hypothetical protein
LGSTNQGSGVQFVDEHEKELFATAKLGEDVRAFLQSHPVGQLLHHRAKQAIRQAEVDALEVDASAWPYFRGRNKLRQIRQRADVARAFIQWMADAITDGDGAARELEDYRQ